MKKVLVRISLISLFIFVACSSPQADIPSQTSIPTITASPTFVVVAIAQPTPTIVHTNTPSPTVANTPTPLATVTPQPTNTSTPPVEQAWSFSPDNTLPKIDGGNTVFEQFPDGTGLLRFFDKNDLPYFIELNPPAELLTRRGGVINGELTVILSRSSPDPTFVPPLPKITVQDSSGDRLAWFDLDSGQWYKRYETIFTKSLEDYDQNLNHPWIGRDLGLEMYNETSSSYLSGHIIFLSGRVTRIWTEQFAREAGNSGMPNLMKWEGGLGKTTWIDLTYNLEGNVVEILVNSDLEHVSELLFLRHRSQLLLITDGQTYYEVARNGSLSYQGPRSIPEPDIVYLNQEILEALQQSDFLIIKLGLSYEDDNVFPRAYLGLTEDHPTNYFVPDPLMRLYYLQANNSHMQKGFLKSLISPYLSASNHLKIFDAYLGDIEPVTEPIPFGYFEMWIVDSDRSATD